MATAGAAGSAFTPIPAPFPAAAPAAAPAGAGVGVFDFCRRPPPPGAASSSSSSESMTMRPSPVSPPATWSSDGSGLMDGGHGESHMSQLRVAAGFMKVHAGHVHRTPPDQGLTLVHFSAQLERFLWDRGGIQGLFKGSSGVIRGYRRVCRVYFVSETAQVELKIRRV